MSSLVGISDTEERAAEVSSDQGGPSPESVRRLWHRSIRRTVLVPLVVLAPLVSLAPTADHRFNIYLNGGLYRDNPLWLFWDNFASVPHYLQLGNFRPIGRCLEALVDLTTFLLTDIFGLPANVSLRLVSFLAAVVLSLTVLVFTECFLTRSRLSEEPPSMFSAAIPFAMGMGLVAAGFTSTTVLFGGLYMLSSAVVFAVAALVLWATPTSRRAFAIGWIALLVLVGAALASVNELVYFALPVATLAVLLRERFVLERGWREVWSGAGVRIVGWMWLGFVPVFLVTRAIIWGHCHSGGCYEGSDIVLGTDAVVALPNRLLSWLAPLMWHASDQGGGHPLVRGLLPIAAVVIIGFLAWHAIRDLRELRSVDRRRAFALAAVAGALVVLGATLAALSGQVQAFATSGDWGTGWRDSAVTPFAGGLLIIALVGGIVASHRFRRRFLAGLIVVMAVAAVVSTLANQRFRDAVSGEPDLVIANRVALEMADFDRSPAGNTRRCDLRQQFFGLKDLGPLARDRFDKGVNAASMAEANVPFCVPPPRATTDGG
jgi:hypothetical protein